MCNQKVGVVSLNQSREEKSFRVEGRGKRLLIQGVVCCVAGLLTASCGGINPHNVDVSLPQEKPYEKVTSLTKALSDLGLMTKIYDPGEVKIQSQDIADKTGAAATTGAEIQRNITEIMKSTLNTIGGEVTFIEYDPSYIQNQMVTGYGNFENKLVPDVVITGGITEFDRGLVTHSEGTNLDVEAPVSGLPKWVPGDTVGFGFGDTEKAGTARITLDFNLKDFQTLAGIHKMTTTNSMEVHKGLHEKELGVTILGPTFGLKGTTKKVQGRHEAVRMLVQVSMIQMLGKYMALPYWKLLGVDARPDLVVLDSISSTYYNMAPEQRNYAVQQWLILHGYNLKLTGKLDGQTKEALKKYDPSFSVASTDIPEELFTDIYLSIPINHQALSRRNLLNNMLAELYAAPEPQQTAPAPQQKQAAPAAQPVQQQETVQDKPKFAPSPKQVEKPVMGIKNEPKKKAAKSRGLGRKLSDDEW